MSRLPFLFGAKPPALGNERGNNRNGSSNHGIENGAMVSSENFGYSVEHMVKFERER